MNGVTGRMGTNQHLVRSICAIRAQGGVALADGTELQAKVVVSSLDPRQIAFLITRPHSTDDADHFPRCVRVAEPLEQLAAIARERVREAFRQLEGEGWLMVEGRRGAICRAVGARLRAEFGIYAVDSGRICVASLNNGNVNYVAESIAKVL